MGMGLLRSSVFTFQAHGSSVHTSRSTAPLAALCVGPWSVGRAGGHEDRYSSIAHGEIVREIHGDQAGGKKKKKVNLS